MNKAKIISLALVLAMLVSAFGIFVPAAGAETVSPDNPMDIRISGTDVDNDEIFIGDQDVNFWVDIRNDWGGTTTNPDILGADLSFSTTVRTETGGNLPTGTPNPIDNWDKRVVLGSEAGGGNIPDGWTQRYSGFQFDVATNALPGTYNLTVTLYNATNSNIFTGYILIEIFYRGNVQNMPHLIPGDKDKEVLVWVNSHNDGDSRMQHIYLNITIRSADVNYFSWYGLATATATSFNENIWGGGNTGSFPYTISVSKNTPSGTYQQTYVLEYTNDDDERCRETGTIVFTVQNLAMLSATITGGTIAQGVVSTTMALTFTNTGTVDLLGVRVWIDDESGDPTNPDDFFFTVADHWEGMGTVTYGWVEIGDIAKGATATANIDVGIDLYIPEGKHKLMFGFSGKYLDPDTRTYKMANSWWDWLGIQHAPKVSMGGTTITLDPDFSSVEGTFVWITVTDTVIDVEITSLVTLNAGGQTFDNVVRLNVNEIGSITYTNMVIQIETNTANSPFTNVVNPTATLSEPAVQTYHYMYGDHFPVHVNLKPDTRLGVYMVPVTVTAVNSNMGEQVTTTVNARITVRGIGPQIEVTAVTPESIKPGQDFTLTLTLSNVGDDTARNIIINSAVFVPDEETTINGNYAEPRANALPLFVGDIAPGASITVDIPMKSNSDMSKGHVYAMLFSMQYVDSMGYSPSVDSFAVSVKSTGGGGSVLGTFYWSMVMLAIVIMVFLIIVAIFHIKKNKKPKAEPVQEYQPEFQPPPPPPSE